MENELFTAWKTAENSVLDRQVVRSDNIILTRNAVGNEWTAPILTRNERVRRGRKKVIFCILDRGVQRVIKMVMDENVVKSRILR